MTPCDIINNDRSLRHMDWFSGGLKGYQSDWTMLGLPLLIIYTTLTHLCAQTVYYWFYFILSFWTIRRYIHTNYWPPLISSASVAEWLRRSTANPPRNLLAWVRIPLPAINFLSRFNFSFADCGCFKAPIYMFYTSTEREFCIEYELQGFLYK